MSDSISISSHHVKTLPVLQPGRFTVAFSTARGVGLSWDVALATTHSCSLTIHFQSRHHYVLCWELTQYSVAVSMLSLARFGMLIPNDKRHSLSCAARQRSRTGKQWPDRCAICCVLECSNVWGYGCCVVRCRLRGYACAYRSSVMTRSWP